MSDITSTQSAPSHVSLPAQGLRAAVVLASAGRAAELGDVIADLAGQTYPIASKVVCVPTEESLPAHVPADWKILLKKGGLTAQRNAGVEAVGDAADVIFFFDDDSVVREDYIANGIAFFTQHPSMVGMTGRVLIDGTPSGGEVSREIAYAAVAASDRQTSGRFSKSRTLYGCNFAYRREAASSMRFDERLPLYSWLEDHDFARRLMRIGELAKVADCVCVHRRAGSGGRANHLRLGYSQFMNPMYLLHKGSLPIWLAAWEIFRPTAKNVARALVSSERSWRRERLRGNLLAVSDVLRGKFTPERIVKL